MYVSLHQAITDKTIMLLMMMWPLQLPPHTYRKHIVERPLKINNSKAVTYRTNTVTKKRSPLEKCICLSICLRAASAFHPNLNIIRNS